MSSHRYCSDDDVFTLGLDARAFEVRARKFDDVDAASGTIRLKAHGLTAEDVVVFEVTTGGTLPTGESAYVPRYPLIVSFDLLQLAATPSGTALTWADGGEGWLLAVDPLRRIQAHAEAVTATIDQKLVAHATPIQVDPITGKYPMVLRALAARMTARAAVTSLQAENPRYKSAVDRLLAQEEFDNAMLDGFEKNGIPIRPAPTDTTPGVADNGARGATVDYSNGGYSGCIP